MLLLGFVLLNNFKCVDQQTIKAEDIEIKKILSQTNSIACTLESKKRAYKIGESPELTVNIINQLDSAITMVGSLDGSDIGLRPPISYFMVRHQLLGSLWNPSIYCATFNQIRKEDFQTVKSKDQFNPYQQIDNDGYFNAQQLEGRNFYFPGIYEITYYYSTAKDSTKYKSEQIYDQKTKNELIEVWSKVPNLELTSNTITIEYNL